MSWSMGILVSSRLLGLMIEGDHSRRYLRKLVSRFGWDFLRRSHRTHRNCSGIHRHPCHFGRHRPHWNYNCTHHPHHNPHRLPCPYSYLYLLSRSSRINPLNMMFHVSQLTFFSNLILLTNVHKSHILVKASHMLYQRSNRRDWTIGALV